MDRRTVGGAVNRWRRVRNAGEKIEQNKIKAVDEKKTGGAGGGEATGSLSEIKKRRGKKRKKNLSV